MLSAYQMVDVRLDEESRPERWLAKFHQVRRKHTSTPRALWQLFRCRILVMSLFMILCGCCEFLGTIGLTSILTHLAGSPRGTPLRSWFAASLFGISPIIRGLCMQTFEFHSTRNICHLKSMVIHAIYQKLLKQRPGARPDAGRVTSLVAADTDKIATLRYTLMAAFLVPTEITVASVLLYRTIGWSYIPGLAVLLLTRIPISWLIGRYQEAAQGRVMAAIDARVRRVAQAVKGLQTVKFLGLEDAFGAWIDELRKKEMDALWHKLVIITASDVVSGAFTLVPLVLSLGFYTLVAGQRLTPDVVFTVVAIFNTLKGMMALAVVGVSTYAQAFVSLRRLAGFLDDGDVAEHLALDLDMECKSTLIKALLNEMPVVRGVIGARIFPGEVVSYAGQAPWLKGRSVREAILFHSPFSKARYEEVLQDLGLDIDLQSIPNGDLGDLGANCAALSGGQKARVALARAIYAETRTILLDDILAALDMTTTTLVVERCLLGPLILNRFSADMFSLDNTVTELLKQVVDNFLAIAFRLVAVSSLLPTFLAPAMVLLGLGMFTGQVYLYGSTASKRLYAACMSPLLVDIADSISGIEVIRAHGVQYSYAVYLSSLLEVEMSSFQRIEEYIHRTPQEQRVAGNDTPPPAPPSIDWPSDGRVELRSVTASYATDSNPVLWDIDLAVKPGTCVALVGRSGSGKSSLAATILRLTTKLRGDVFIDGTDINNVDLSLLRRKISFIPQDPTLFAGTLRLNIDFLGERSDAALQGLLDAVMGGPMGAWSLDHIITANGSNLSQGERQLVAMVRALASDSRILIIDEATASLDAESDMNT
ncbi:hypothetical protein N0V88_000764 [Collariella sp. IMI 366227]|nr:hypothetical protein N0V88_000764 [Collariella sp. IMI 366227]